MSTLFPRLSPQAATDRIAKYSGSSAERVAAMADSTLAELPITYASTGGTRVSPSGLVELRDAIRSIAARCGYPAAVTLEGQQRFDRETALYLRAFPGLDAGEGVRAGTWQFMAAGLLPDIVVWRWSSGEGDSTVSPDRILGGNRNCLGRLWQRGVVFWDERIVEPSAPLRLLLEDNFVAMLERSAFAAQIGPLREIARAFLLRRHLVEASEISSPAQTLLRDAMRRAVRSAAYCAMWALDDDELRAHVALLLDKSLQAMEVPPVPEARLLETQPELALKRGTPAPTATAAIDEFVPEPEEETDLEPIAPLLAAEGPLPGWDTMAAGQRTDTVWRILVGVGPKPQDDLVRIAAQTMRARGQLAYERLREGGQVFTSIEEAIERGVRYERFDKPWRGARRAVARSFEEVPLATFEDIALGVVAKGVASEDLMPLLVNELKERIGLEMPRSRAQSPLTKILNALRAQGRLIEEGGVLRGAHASQDAE